MKSKIALFFGICTLAILAVYLSSKNSNMEALDLSSLTGKIAISQINNKTTGKSSGVNIFDLTNGENKLILSEVVGNICNPIYGENSDVIIADELNKNSIIQYDQKSAEKKCILNYQKSFHFRYIPKQNSISYYAKLGNGYGIYTYNLDSKKEAFLGKFDMYYSWDTSGQNLYYSNDGFIQRYNLQDKKSYKLFEGDFPEISPNSKYIAYIPSGNDEKNRLIIRDINNGTEWQLKTSYIHYVRFSPDSENIAILRTTAGWLSYYEYELYIWNFKSGKGVKFLKDLTVIDSFDWK